jgi:hypothetical protein
VRAACVLSGGGIGGVSANLRGASLPCRNSRCAQSAAPGGPGKRFLVEMDWLRTVRILHTEDATDVC